MEIKKGKRLSREEAQALARAAIGPRGVAYVEHRPLGPVGQTAVEWCVGEVRDALTLETYGRGRSYREAFEDAGVFMEVKDD